MKIPKRTVALHTSVLVTGILAALCGGVACSEETSDDSGGIIGQPIAGSGIGNPPQGSGGASGIAGSGTVIIPTNPNGSSGGGGGPAGGLEACATGSAKADLTPVNMFIQFDRSTSMLDDNKWVQAAQALTAFFADPATQGLKVALRFFPHDSPVVGCTGGQIAACSVDACAAPLVPLGELSAQPAPTDNQEALLIQAVNMSTPIRMQGGGMQGGGMQSGGTPIYPALAGALTWAANNQLQLPDERTVVVLVTDGEPNGCDTDIDNIAELASAALANNGIPTYAIGIAGAREDQLNQIARAGGTNEAFFAGDTMTAQQDLVNALNAIRGTVLSCAFPLPSGSNVDPTKVNIRFTAGTGAEQTLGQTMNAGACTAAGGWYYDNPTRPTNITLCPSTCDSVQADTAGRLDVVLGCATMVR